MWSGTNVWVGHEMSEMSGWSICFYISIFQYLISMGFPMVYKSTLLNEQPFLEMTRSRRKKKKKVIDSYDIQCKSICLSSLTKKVEKNGGMCGHCALPFASRCTFLDFHSFLKNFCSVL